MRRVYSGMGAGRARRLCPQAAVVPCRMEAYSEASKAVFRIFEDTAPVVEALSIDEAFLDVRGMEHFAGTPVEIATRLRRRVREEVGLPISVGVARTKFLAKVASAVAKPDGLLLVPPDGELEFLHPLPVERLWGVGPITSATPARCRAEDRGTGGRAGGGCAGGDCSGVLRDVTCMRWPTCATRGAWNGAGGGARSAPSTRSAGARAHPRRSTRAWSGSWTA